MFDRSVLTSTWNKTDIQTHFSPILDLLSDCFDGEHVELKWFFDIHFLFIPIDHLEWQKNGFESQVGSK